MMQEPTGAEVALDSRLDARQPVEQRQQAAAHRWEAGRRARFGKARSSAGHAGCQVRK